ncbi:MAG: hypothetical protein U5K29_08715 [Acidimicrobiales bacterium]|nr:hypothetical protein [Acidimicrobiales bacterium]
MMYTEPHADRSDSHRGPDHDLEHRVISMLKSHGPREGEALASYARLAEETEDGGHAYLMRLILEDERRHHRTIDEMLNTVQSFVWDVDVEPSVPSAARYPDRRIHQETKRLLAFEREDAKELRQLKKALQQDKTWPFLALLVDLMIQDTKKHIEILKFVQKLTKP